MPPIAITESAVSLPFPPTAVAWVPDGWNDDDPVDKLQVLWSADADTNITSGRLLGLRQVPFTFSDITFTATHGTETFTSTGHGLKTGVGPVLPANSGGALPAGLEADEVYWIIRVDANSFKLAASLEDAFAGVAVAITDNGTGTHTLVDIPVPAQTTADPDEHTHRVVYDSYGLLGDAADGAFSVSADGLAYTIRANHKETTIGYSVTATLSAANVQKIYIEPVLP